MKTKFGKKVKMFWDKNKANIIFLAGALVMLGAESWAIGMAVKSYKENQEQKAREEAERKRLKAEEAAKYQEDRINAMKKDPDNQIAGGWVLEDYLYEPDEPYLIANDVPLSDLGDFGQEIIRRAKDQGLDGCGWGDAGVEKVEEARASVIINLYGPGEDEEQDEQKEKEMKEEVA